MPKSKPAISTDVLLTELDKLAGSLLITAEQAGLILSRTQKQLSDDRAAGNPPPFVKVHGSLRYTIGDLRDFIKRNTFKSTAAASRAKKEQASGLAHASFSHFVHNGRHDDRWPFMIEADQPIEFFHSLTLGLTDDAVCEWLTLERYLQARREFALAQPKLETNAALTAEFQKVESRQRLARTKSKRPTSV